MRRARILSQGFSEAMRPVIQLELDRPLESELRGLELDMTLVKHREHRSLRQNAYYWQLLSEVAGALRVPITEAHNRMLRDYGQPYIVDGRQVYVPFPDTDEVERELLRAETYHVAPTDKVKEGQGGRTFRWYRMIRGSSDYNTAEMSRLVDGLVEQAKQMGIETLTPDELQRMRAYEQQREGEKRRAGAGEVAERAGA